jgi:chloramphenicol-sensitive protein RarD
LETEHRGGVLQIIAAYVAWGLFPFYWKQIAYVPALEVIGHRIFWSFVTLALLLTWKGSWGWLRRALASRRALLVYAAAAILISVNWLAYIWAVNHGAIVETSLGYFINPLMTVVLGVAWFGERMRAVQWIAIGFAFLGVLYLTLAYGKLPWVALTLASTFSAYSVVKKLAPLGSREGLTLETAMVAPVALAYLVSLDRDGSGAFVHGGWWTSLFLAGAGAVTTLPLLLFASAVQRVPLSLIGVFQYISPTLQLLAGVLFYGEPFSAAQRIGFGAVWTGLAIYAVDGWRSRRRRPVLLG